MALDIDIESFDETTFEADMASSLGVEPEQVVVTPVKAGSTIVNFNVQPLEGETTLPPDTTASVTQKLETGNITLSPRFGNFTVSAMVMPATPPEDNSLEDWIVGSIAGGCVLFALLFWVLKGRHWYKAFRIWKAERDELRRLKAAAAAKEAAERAEREREERIMRLSKELQERNYKAAADQWRSAGWSLLDTLAAMMPSPTDEGEPPQDGAPIESTDVEAIVHHRPRRQRGEQGPRVADILNAKKWWPQEPALAGREPGRRGCAPARGGVAAQLR